MMEQEKLTLEERIARSARSQAASPEAAAKLVQRLAQLHTAHVFHGNADLDLMYELIGPYMEQIEDDLLYYSGFCHSINFSVAKDTPSLGDDFRCPPLNPHSSNAVVLLGLMFLDHAKGRGKDKEVYHCTRMTLGQYLDALETLSFQEDQPARASFQNWRNALLNIYDASAPLADVLSALLRQYIRGWKMFDCLDHIQRCMEVVTEDEREQYPDPGKHYLDLANSYCWDMPDPAGEEVSARAVRGQIFFPDRVYSPQFLQELVSQAPTPEFRALLEEIISAQVVAKAASEVNESVLILLELLVVPYLWMGKRPK